MNNTSLSILRADMAERCQAMPADASANDVMLWASVYIEHLERELASLMQEERESERRKSSQSASSACLRETEEAASPAYAAAAAVSAASGAAPAPAPIIGGSSSHDSLAAVSSVHESPKLGNPGEKEALLPFGSPHSALREIARNLERNAIPQDEAELAELLDRDSFLTDLLQ